MSSSEAWDPKSPATLLVPSLTTTTGDDENAMEMNYLLCDTGVGCNSYESSAIMNLLDARDACLEQQRSVVHANNSNHGALLSLSKDYRKALSNCIDEWSEALTAKNESSQENDDDVQQQQEQQDLDLLKATYAIAQLSELFLLLPNGDDGYNNYETSTMALPGAITAEMVRFLRLHYLGNAEDLFDPETLEYLYEAMAPDLYEDDGPQNSYWDLIEAHLLRGCLEEAWALLSHHSTVRRFLELDQESSLNDYQAASLAEDREGFRALKSILLSAPLPGGRNSDSDSGFDETHNETSEAVVVEEDELIDGVSNLSYRLWETTNTSSNNNNNRDYPYGFEPTAANQIHQYWKQAIDASQALVRLRRRIPQLNRLLALLVGNFRDFEFGSWQEELCAELLYKTPGIALEDVYFRAAALMEQHATNNENETNSPLENIVLTIMRGNSGEAVRAMHGLGGGSGAALPAVMTSLLSQLLGDADVLQNTSDTFDFNTELLIAASSAIRSSLATEGHHDLGTRLAVRLLLPHIEIDSDLRITANLVDTLEHHSPKLDEEAHILLSLCRKLVERKNVRVLDGCISICLARHLYYTRKNTPGGAVHWLLIGMELESLVLCDGPTRAGDWQRALAMGVCYRKLVAYFSETSRSLLKTCLGEEKGGSLFYERAQEMVKATKDESPHYSNNLASFVPAVKVLENVLAIAGAVVERKDNSIVADGIISCLEERPDDEDDGVVSSLAPSMNWDLLRLAILVLEKDALKKTESTSSDQSISSFDVRGMGVLLSAFTIETKARELRRNPTEEAEEKLQTARLALGKGLKRAFVAENSMKREAILRRNARSSKAGIYPSQFSKHSREQQEHAVQRMLDY